MAAIAAGKDCHQADMGPEGRSRQVAEGGGNRS